MAYSGGPTRPYCEVKTQSAQVLVDSQRKRVYIFPPKCAQTTLRRFIGDYGIKSPVTFEEAKAAIAAGYMVIMAVRDPKARLVSAWRNKFNSLKLSDVAQAAIMNSDHALDIHLRPQAHLLDMLGRPNVDAYIRVGSHMAEDTRRLGLGSPTEHMNASGSKAADYETLPDYVRGALEARYTWDYRLWEEANTRYSGE